MRKTIEGIIEYKNEISINCISIETGSNEGYYVKIQEEKNIEALRFHDKDCVIKTLKVMLVFLEITRKFRKMKKIMKG